jgi:hypothetical protein
MEIPQARSILGGQWPMIQAAVGHPEVYRPAGGLQAYVWGQVRTYYAKRGQALPQGAFQAVNALLGAAGTQNRAAIALSRTMRLQERTGFTQALTAAHIAPAVDTRSLSQMPRGPRYKVVYRSLRSQGGISVVKDKTHIFGYALPQDLSSLQDAITTASQIDAADYEQEWEGADVPISIQSY